MDDKMKKYLRNVANGIIIIFAIFMVVTIADIGLKLGGPFSKIPPVAISMLVLVGLFIAAYDLGIKDYLIYVREKRKNKNDNG